MPYCFEQFSGLPVKADSFAEGFATVAENIDFSCGRLDPWRTPLLAGQVPEDSDQIFLKDGKLRYSANKGTTVVHSLSGMTFISDPCDCVYFRKDWCDEEKRPLGLPRPDAPDLVGLSPAPTDDDCWTPELVSVEITYQSRCDHYKYESQPSAPSNQIKCKLGDDLQVYIPPVPDTKYPIDTVCIYMTHTTWDVTQGLHGYPALGRNLQGRAPEVVDTNFETNAQIFCFKIAEIPYNPNGGTVVIEKPKDLGKTLTTKGWAAPPEGLCLAGESDTGSLVGYTEECLMYSIRNSPHAWRFADIMQFGSKIIMACHVNITTYVFTASGEMFIVTDDNDCTIKGSCRSVRRVSDIPKPCVNKFNKDKATICLRFGVVYPSEWGIVYVQPDGNFRIILRTDDNRNAWRGQISMALYRNQLFVTGFEQPVILSLPILGEVTGESTATMSNLSCCPKCFYEECGDLYMLDWDGKVYKWNAGNECLPMRYKSSALRIQGLNLTTMSVEFTDFAANQSIPCDSTVTTYRNGAVNQVKTVRNCDPLRIRPLANAKTFCFEYNGTQSVRRVCIGSSFQDLSVAA